MTALGLITIMVASEPRERAASKMARPISSRSVSVTTRVDSPSRRPMHLINMFLHASIAFCFTVRPSQRSSAMTLAKMDLASITGLPVISATSAFMPRV